MLPYRLPMTNRVYKAPDGWDEAANGKCLDLPVVDMSGSIASAWTPSKEEIELINSGMPIIISLCLPKQCVMSVGVADLSIINPPEFESEPVTAEMLEEIRKGLAVGHAIENASRETSGSPDRFGVPGKYRF